MYGIFPYILSVSLYFGLIKGIQTLMISGETSFLVLAFLVPMLFGVLQFLLQQRIYSDLTNECMAWYVYSFTISKLIVVIWFVVISLLNITIINSTVTFLLMFGLSIVMSIYAQKLFNYLLADTGISKKNIIF